MADIFISYSSEDRDRVIPLVKALKDRGWSVWWDRDLPLTSPFDDVIRVELRSARCVVALWSENSVNSLYVKGEARDAMRLNKLISVFISLSPFELPYDLQSLQGLELIDWNGEELDANYQRLIQGISSKISSSSQKAINAVIEEVKDKPQWRDQGTYPKQVYSDKHKNRLRKIVGTVVLLIVIVCMVTALFLTSKTKKLSDLFTNSIGMEFLYIAPGTFSMGISEDDPTRDFSDRQHRVILTKGFYMQSTEVTQRQWQTVMGKNPSYFKDCGDNCPVETVSWNDVQDFVDKLNQNTDAPGYYRLPYEAEWEYAARAGTKTRYAFGHCLSTEQANYGGNYIYINGCPDGTPRDKTIEVASFPPNNWGLHDMHGNVAEWCMDWYADYPNYDELIDPKGASKGWSRVARGGAFNSNAELCSSDSRFSSKPKTRSNVFGFRLVFILL